ncbi:unnamed protein product [Protopolystoma xenopodis]|uniref:Uncharacterized protein n=1 Tax=Protopolystoma xenopodis TaxID=117903 RepID=A0A3S5BG50_9PLAT|nr:unnamed protein product [Protopolystoma xenopodis]
MSLCAAGDLLACKVNTHPRTPGEVTLPGSLVVKASAYGAHGREFDSRPCQLKLIGMSKLVAWCVD